MMSGRRGQLIRRATLRRSDPNLLVKKKLSLPTPTRREFSGVRDAAMESSIIQSFRPAPRVPAYLGAGFPGRQNMR